MMLLGWDKDRMLSVGVLGVDMTITCQMSEVLGIWSSLDCACACGDGGATYPFEMKQVVLTTGLNVPSNVPLWAARSPLLALLLGNTRSPSLLLAVQGHLPCRPGDDPQGCRGTHAGSWVV